MRITRDLVCVLLGIVLCASAFGVRDLIDTLSSLRSEVTAIEQFLAAARVVHE